MRDPAIFLVGIPVRPLLISVRRNSEPLRVNAGSFGLTELLVGRGALLRDPISVLDRKEDDHGEFWSYRWAQLDSRRHLLASVHIDFCILRCILLSAQEKAEIGLAIRAERSNTTVGRPMAP